MSTEALATARPLHYLIITKEDADELGHALEILDRLGFWDDAKQRIRDRLRDDTGADIEDIVHQLKTMGLCGACIIEGQQSGCSVLSAQKLGRRLNRLLERARGERAPGNQPPKETPSGAEKP